MKKLLCSINQFDLLKNHDFIEKKPKSVTFQGVKYTFRGYQYKTVSCQTRIALFFKAFFIALSSAFLCFTSPQLREELIANFRGKKIVSVFVKDEVIRRVSNAQEGVHTPPPKPFVDPKDMPIALPSPVVEPDERPLNEPPAPAQEELPKPAPQVSQEVSPPITTENLVEALTTIPRSLLNRGVMKAYPSISECHCCIGLSRDINKFSDIRKRIETKLVQAINNKFPKNQPLKILSIASGGCFQELVLHALLVKSGYTVHWTVIDPTYFDSKSSKTVEDFEKLVKEISPDSKVKAWYDMEGIFAEYQRENSPDLPQVVLAIDADLNHLNEITPELQESMRDDPHYRRLPQKPNMINDLAKLHLLVSSRFNHPRIQAWTEKVSKTNIFPQISYFSPNNRIEEVILS